MKDIHHVETEEVAHDADDIGDHTPLFHSQFLRCPPLIVAVDMDEQRGQQDGHGIDKRQDDDLVTQVENAKIAENEQRHHSHERQIERRENHAQHTCGKDNVLLFHR